MKIDKDKEEIFLLNKIFFFHITHATINTHIILNIIFQSQFYNLARTIIYQLLLFSKLICFRF